MFISEKRKKSVKDYESINEMQSQFTYVEVNGMKITDPQQVYQQFYKVISLFCTIFTFTVIR